jgi:hypothetical protein
MRDMQYDHRGQQDLAMNWSLELILAWFVRNLQSSSGECFRTKVMEEDKGHSVLSSNSLGMA